MLKNLPIIRHLREQQALTGDHKRETSDKLEALN